MPRLFDKFKSSRKQDESVLASGSQTPSSEPQAPPPSYDASIETSTDTKLGQSSSSSHARPPSFSQASTTTAVGNVADDDNPPPYHNWQSIPDTSLLPPPPALPHSFSSTTNASTSVADKAHAWCDRFPVYKPKPPSQVLLNAVREGDVGLDPPPGFKGTLNRIETEQAGSAYVVQSYPSTSHHTSDPYSSPSTNCTPGDSTSSKHKGGLFASSKSTGGSLFSSTSSRFSSNLLGGSAAGRGGEDEDLIFLSRLPLCFAAADHPLVAPLKSSTFRPPAHNVNSSTVEGSHSELKKNLEANTARTDGSFTIYFEIRVLSLHSPSATVSIGFAAKPYPPFRQPGWHRASIAVHGDDGRRFVNDPWGGRDFVEPFRPGEVLGLGITFKQEESGQSGGRVRGGTLRKVKTKVFFTRNGRIEGGWDMDEERDAEKDEGITGLQGESDLYAAVGTFGKVDVQVNFLTTHSSPFLSLSILD